MRVTILCGGGGPPYPWGPFNVENGIGGSEECVVYLAKEMAALGHEVVVSNKCLDREGVYEGVTYQNFDKPIDKCDLLVAWRDWILLINNHDKAPNHYLWCHDIPVGCHCPCQEEIDREDSAFKYIDKFVLLNNYHSSIYAHIPMDKKLVIPIGVNQDHFDVMVDRIPGRVLYFSHPHRGLHKLRDVWPQIKKRVSHATLAAFWWEEEFFHHEDEALGILPMAHLGPSQIAIECLKADVFGYPSVFGCEISPATTIKAQMGGAIPVVIVQGGMIDTCAYGRKIYGDARNSDVMDSFVDNIVSCLEDNSTEGNNTEDYRQRMIAWAKDTYSWKNVAKKWIDSLTR